MDKKSNSTGLTNPNDDSPGQCYAPAINGRVEETQKRHFDEGKSPHSGWVKVPCDSGCELRSAC